MKNKNLILRVASAVAGVLGVVFGFLVNFDFKTVTDGGVIWVEKEFGLLSQPDETLIETYEYLGGTTFKSAFKVVAAVALFVCLAAVLVLVASLVVELLNKKCEVLDKVANIAKYVLVVATIVFVAGLLLFVTSNQAEIEGSTVKLAMTNLVLGILSFVMLAGSAVCAFLAKKETK